MSLRKIVTDDDDWQFLYWNRRGWINTQSVFNYAFRIPGSSPTRRQWAQEWDPIRKKEIDYHKRADQLTKAWVDYMMPGPMTIKDVLIDAPLLVSEGGMTPAGALAAAVIGGAATYAAFLIVTDPEHKIDDFGMDDWGTGGPNPMDMPHHTDPNYSYGIF